MPELEKKEEYHKIDCHVGRQLRSLRNLRRLSQAELADQLGLTFQQLQKYEKGANRVSASVLYTLSKILDVPIAQFYDGLYGEQEPQLIRLSKNQGELISLYNAAPKNFQKAFFKLLKTSQERDGSA